MIYRRPNTGFTIVEIVVIIAVIAILATISYFVVGSWRHDAATTQVKNELIHAASSLKQYQNFNSGYPATEDFSSVYTPGADVTLTYALRSDDSYCLNAVSQVIAEVEWNIDSSVATTPHMGSCVP